MMKIVIFLAFVALSQCQPLEYNDEDQQPFAYYQHDELAPLNRLRRSADQFEGVQETAFYRRGRSIEIPAEQPELVLYYYPQEVQHIEAVERQRRSLQPGAPTFPMPNQEPPTKLTPHITRQDGTTNVGAKVDHKFGNHDASAYWNKNVRGPAKAKPNYGVRGTFRF